MSNWEKLLCTKRQRESSKSFQEANKNNSVVARNEFEADYDRIVGSSSVRRLQDKAQVFPLQENDVTRTRLTHSIEVSAFARSLGKAVGRKLEEKGIFDFKKTEELAALMQTAGLIHDLGNPPFGHYGEKVIRKWFDEWFCEKKLDSKIISDQEKKDFLYFDGNVQNLRIVTSLQTLNDVYGANFTYGTLATIIKYPWKSDEIKHGESKFGYFKSEEELVKEIWEETGLHSGERHPATFLLEAADDIIYMCDDIEDGVKKGCINWDKEFVLLKEKHKKNPEIVELFQKIEDKKPDEHMDESEKQLAIVRNFRNALQTFLFQKAVCEFMDNYEDIMDGTYEGELLNCEKELVKSLKMITAENCFGCQEVIALELVGDKVIRTLLDVFVSVVTENEGKKLLDIREYAGKVFSQISPNFTYIALYKTEKKGKEKSEKIDNMSLYEKLHLVTDFVSGMTDSYAVNLYKKLAGIKLPN